MRCAGRRFRGPGSRALKTDPRDVVGKFAAVGVDNLLRHVGRRPAAREADHDGAGSQIRVAAALR